MRYTVNLTVNLTVNHILSCGGLFVETFTWIEVTQEQCTVVTNIFCPQHLNINGWKKFKFSCLQNFKTFVAEESCYLLAVSELLCAQLPENLMEYQTSNK